ncbi:Type II secretion system protein GspH [Pseudomonas sp. OF001]|jgi:type IV fimbrial biogenesis protein FimT|uniref:GspH/FimT family pseudopilin n=1 Tax=unclassified Pseudomonas TaxID=196821 RepID=UPI0010A623EE|nr:MULTISPECIES: GspH/FimT family pseudopilin [unclassified Pseudomonas]THG83897.1 type II secretion system protein GspH [Pseudomonas sp. A-1]CAD5379882.1 Type II secretion system protein GspH [Pseudomonas sp. OF001]
MQSRNGFSLIELMVVIAIIAIIAGIGIPSFRSITLDSRLNSTANQFLGALLLARSEAITQRTSIRVCAANADNKTCATQTDWTNGTLLVRESDSEVIRVIPAATGLTIQSTQSSVLFRPNGTITPTPLTLTLTEAERSKSHQVRVNAIGQACSGSACP